MTYEELAGLIRPRAAEGVPLKDIAKELKVDYDEVRAVAKLAGIKGNPGRKVRTSPTTGWVLKAGAYKVALHRLDGEPISLEECERLKELLATVL